MVRTLQNILIDVNAYLALDASVPTGSDLTTFTNFADKAVRDAASDSIWECFNKTYITSVSSTMASVSLPTNFRELTTIPRLDVGGNIFYDFPEIRPLERFDKSTSDKYCYVLGNPGEGYTAVFTNLTSGATLSIDYQRYPSGFATLTDVCELPDDTFVVEKVKSYVLQARIDDRFPSVEANANRLLQNMNGREARTPQGGMNTTPHTQNYRIGT